MIFNKCGSDLRRRQESEPEKKVEGKRQGEYPVYRPKGRNRKKGNKRQRTSKRKHVAPNSHF